MTTTTTTGTTTTTTTTTGTEETTDGKATEGKGKDSDSSSSSTTTTTEDKGNNSGSTEEKSNNSGSTEEESNNAGSTEEESNNAGSTEEESNNAGSTKEESNNAGSTEEESNNAGSTEEESNNAGSTEEESNNSGSTEGKITSGKGKNKGDTETTTDTEATTDGSSTTEEKKCTALGVMVDGSANEWTDADFYKNMHNAGDVGKDLVAKAYTRFDCCSRTVCIFAKAEPGIKFATTEAWFKDYTVQSAMVPNAPGIQFVKENDVVVGWEGCFALPEKADGKEVEIHANWGKISGSTGNTASTGKKDDGYSVLSLGCKGGSYGDPHLRTWMGMIYDFHGECDLVLVKTPTFDNGQGLDVHIRTQMVDDWSYISDIAVRIGDDILEVGSKAVYWLDGIAGAELPSTVGGFPLELIHYGIRRHKFVVDLGLYGQIVIKVFSDFLAVEINDAHSDGFGDSVGLMGKFTDGNLVSRDGRIMEDLNEFGMNWQVRDTEPKLFQEEKGPQYPQVCNMPVETSTSRRLSESMVSFEDAAKACEGWAEEAMESCIYDVMATGDLDMAQAGAF